MAAYAIGFITLRNTDWQKEYGEKMPALIYKHAGKVIARTGVELLEGNLPLPTLMVIIEFPSHTDAKAWYDDPDHARLKQLRQSGTDVDLLLANGV